MNVQQISGGVWGLLIGDALGVPYEFNAPEKLPPRAQIEFEPPASFRRTYQGIAPGTWSDDGAGALALLDSLLDCGQLDLNDFALRLQAWRDHGQYAVGGQVFDIGVTTAAALRAFARGEVARESGPRDQNSNGNGSLMRVLPLALWHQGDDGELVRDAMEQSLVTHGHLRAQLCCALYCLWARYLAAGETDAWRAATSTLREVLSAQREDGWKTELKFGVRPDEAPGGTGSGYVVDALHSSRLVMGEVDYENVVKSAVMLGHDTDTTACIAGGVAGVRGGANEIPARWRENLRGQEIVAPLLQRLLERAR